MNRLVALVALLALLSGCAGLDVTPVATNDEKADKRLDGFRYYESFPYLLAYTDNQGGLMTKIVHLPDLTKKRCAHPYNYLASNQTTLNFDHGVLTEAQDIVDTTEIPMAVISAVGKVVSSMANAPTGQVNDVPAPWLFKLTRRGDDFLLIGGPAMMSDGQPANLRPMTIQVRVGTGKQPQPWNTDTEQKPADTSSPGTSKTPSKPQTEGTK